MKVLVISTSDVNGGAARAAFRLHKGFQETCTDSQMLVQLKQTDNVSVLGTSAASGIGQAIAGLRLTLDQLPLKRFEEHKRIKFSAQWLPDRISSRVRQIDPDVVNLHWINAGFMQVESLAKLNKPIVWTLHDMWAFTGGCHYNQECHHYQKSCGACPQLSSKKSRDLSRWVWSRKAKAWKGLNITVVSPSRWLADCTRSSSIFSNARVQVIPNSVDTETYRPYDKRFAREVLKLPHNKRLLLFGALSATSDERKGFHLLQPALELLKKSSNAKDIELVIFGASQPRIPPKFLFKTHYLGMFKDDISLALTYSASDIFILPSIQENLPNTVMEGLACGLPCVAFNIGGVPDMIKHKENGFLVEPYSCSQLAEGIDWLLADSDRYSTLSVKAIKTVQDNFTASKQASRYLSLFHEVIGEKN